MRLFQQPAKTNQSRKDRPLGDVNYVNRTQPDQDKGSRMGFHGTHDEMQVACRDVVLILLRHHLQRFGFGFIAALVMHERGLHFPVLDLVTVRMPVAGVLVRKAVGGPIDRLERIFQQ